MASENRTPAHAPGGAAAVFELKRFGWLTPDRLELSGTFGGLPDARLDASPVLVVLAGDHEHRLAAVPDSLSGPPRDGRFWQAAFAGRDAPAEFDAAQLQLGGGLVVELPAAGAKQRLSRARVLEVRTTHPDGANPPEASSGIVLLPGAESTDRKSEDPRPAHPADASLGTHADLLAAQEESRAVRIAMEQIAKELSRARDDLRAEREHRADDGERFRVGLAKLRESAEQALVEKDTAAETLRSELEEKDAALGTLRGQLEAARAAVAQAESTEGALREKVMRLESDGEETERLRAEVERSRATVDQARLDVQRLIGKLAAIRTN